jgi:hypothetical protein
MLAIASMIQTHNPWFLTWQQCVSDLSHGAVFLRVLRFPPPIKYPHNITEILLKVALHTIILTLKCQHMKSILFVKQTFQRISHHKFHIRFDIALSNPSSQNKPTRIHMSLRFSQFSGCWLILSVYIIMSFDFPFVRLLGVG